MKILLTGSSGFIGKNLVTYLMSLGHEVLAIGRHALKIKDLESIVTPGFTLQDLEGSLSPYQFDAVINLAAAGVNPGDRDVSQLLQVNAMLPSYLAMIAAQKGAKGLITIGSGAEYKVVHPTDSIAESTPLETDRLYGTSKAAGGIMALATGKNLGLPVAVTRLFNVFGPGEAPHRLLPCLFNGLKEQKQVSLSSGSQIRDFIYVEDVCSGIVSALNSLLDGKLDPGVYNMSTGIGTSVAEFCRTTARLMGADESLLDFGALPFRPDDNDMVVGDPTLFKSHTGWKPDFTCEMGILRSLELYGMQPRFGDIVESA